MQYGTWKCIVCNEEGEWMGSMSPDRVCKTCGSDIEIINTKMGYKIQEAKIRQNNFARDLED